MNFLNTNISDILKVDGGHCMVTPRLHHAASQPPLLRSSIELEDFVIVVVTAIVIVAVIATWDANISRYRSPSSHYVVTCEEHGIVHGGHPHPLHGPVQQASQAPGAGPRDQQLRGEHGVPPTLPASSHQQHLAWGQFNLASSYIRTHSPCLHQTHSCHIRAAVCPY